MMGNSRSSLCPLITQNRVELGFSFTLVGGLTLTVWLPRIKESFKIESTYIRYSETVEKLPISCTTRGLPAGPSAKVCSA